MEKIFQNILAMIVMLVIGFIFLVKGADLFVDGSSKIANKLKVPSIIIGLTIVAMGTSLPELAVSVKASILGNNTLAVSNVIGSNICNLLLVIGVSAIITFVPLEKDTLKNDFPISICGAVLLLIMGICSMNISRIDGIILFVVFVIYIVKVVKVALNAREKNTDLPTGEVSLTKCILFMIIGMLGVIIGGELVVNSATSIATDMGISQTLIGLTIVAIGTSLPELVTSIVAAKKKDVGVALGNAIGSNIFNIFMILGLSGIFSPMSIISENILDICFFIIFSIIVCFIVLKKRGINRSAGIVMVSMYILYSIYICLR